MAALRHIADVPDSELHACGRCGHQSAHRWRRCPRCLAFASDHAKASEDELALASNERSLDRPIALPLPAPLSEIATEALPRRSTGLPELDRVLGQSEDGSHGVAPGQALVLGGEPGIGKSTLLLQAVAGLCSDARSRV